MPNKLLPNVIFTSYALDDSLGLFFYDYFFVYAFDFIYYIFDTIDKLSMLCKLESYFVYPL